MASCWTVKLLLLTKRVDAGEITLASGVAERIPAVGVEFVEAS